MDGMDDFDSPSTVRLAAILAGRSLPRGTHAALLTADDIVTGGEITALIVWADRPYDACPNCAQDVEREVEGCPVEIYPGAGAGGAIREWSKQHGCGEWLDVNWREVQHEDGDEEAREALMAAADELATGLTREVTGAREALERGLRSELRTALARLADPLDPGETPEDRIVQIKTGSDMDPGVCFEVPDNAQVDGADEEYVYALAHPECWSAWDYDPEGRAGRDAAEPIIVTPADLATEPARA